MILDLPTDEKLIAQLFGNQPDSVVWFSPILDPKSQTLVIDFEVRYCNNAACKILGTTLENILGRGLLTSGLMDETSLNLIFEQCLKVWNTGESTESTYYSPGFDKHFNVQRSKVANGILSITRDRTKEVRAEEQQKRQAILLQKIIDNSPTCIVLCQAIRENYKITDFQLLMVNSKIERDLQRPKEEIVKMTYCTLHPAVKSNGLIDILASVVESGLQFNKEVYLEVFGGWFLLTVDKVDDDKVIATYLNINESKGTSEKLAAQAAWYDSILKHSSNGIIAAKSIRNAQGDIMDFEVQLANPSGIRMANLPENAHGRKLGELLPQLKTAGYLDLHKNVVHSRQTHSATLPFNNGKYEGWYQVSLAPLEDGFVSNFMDITELKQKQETIEEQAQLLDVILNSSINGVYSLDAVRDENGTIFDFTISHVNEVFCQLSRRKKQDLIGKRYLEIFPHTLTSGVFQRNCKVLEDGTPLRLEHHYKGDGVDNWYDTSIHKVSDNRLVIAFIDITPLKNAARKLEISNEELTRSNERLSNFTHIASHDLNEPLRKILTYSSLVTDRFGTDLQPEITEHIAKIQKTAGRMQELINDLLIYSQITSGKKQHERISLNEVLDNVQNDLETLIAKRNAKIVIGQLPNVLGDRTQLSQVFQNLISNAIKFQKQNDEPYIQIRNERVIKHEGTTYYQISVIDNGIGFDQKESDIIFGLFQRLHSRVEFEGTGIGLAIVQKGMENHHGFVRVKSEPGKGSSFFLYFPVM